jgi:hypothetical protein
MRQGIMEAWRAVDLRLLWIFGGGMKRASVFWVSSSAGNGVKASATSVSPKLGTLTNNIKPYSFILSLLSVRKYNDHGGRR